VRQPFLFYIPHRMNTLSKRLFTSSKSALPKAGKTIWWLLKIILPISLIVSFLQYWGIIAQIATILSPAFSLIGLPGESAVVFITSIFVPLYGPIAIISTLPLDMREITILALMCLISHNLFVETAIQKKTGSSALIMFFLRLSTSIIGAFILNQLLPEHIGSSHVVQQSLVFGNIPDMLRNWIIDAGFLSFKIALIITGLMILQSILKEFNLLIIISGLFAPLMRMMGLYNDSSFLWFVAQTLGLGYGSAIMIEEVKNKAITPGSANLLNYHIAINHSLLEDTLLFVAIGVPAGWIIAPRFILAIAVVWSVRGITKLRYSKKKEPIISINE
jgi:Fe2+ transport system protein B